MKYIKKLLLISSVILVVPETSHSGAVEDIGPPLKLTRQKADGILRLKIDLEDAQTNPAVGSTIGTIHIIDNNGTDIEVERVSDNLISIAGTFYRINDQNKILESYYPGGILLGDYLKLLFPL